MDPIKDKELFRDTIATVDDRGKRIWIYPKKPKGRFTNARTYISWLLLVVLFGVPFVKINGEPLLLFNILERRFILFGIQFTPQDFHLFGLAMLTFIVFIILFTVVFGRLFCGWVCPQTIFMEMVFRKIEYAIEGDANAQRRLNNSPWTTEKIIKKATKNAIFFAIAVLVANTFLAYIIGINEVYKIATEPVAQNLTGFMAMVGFSAMFYFVFSWFREQVCTTVCPYGRLQGVLLDRNSIVVVYDFLRGEPRGKIRKKRKKSKPNPAESPLKNIQGEVAKATSDGESAEKEIPLGDCIACNLCVKVCPTGIDIRDGTQLECVNCTACIDACDEVMDKIGRSRGLIRYDSYAGIVEKRKKLFTPRVIAYTCLLSLLVIINVVLLGLRADVEVLLLRTRGMLYQKVDDNTFSNLYNYQITNKTKKDLPIEFVLKNEGGNIKLIGNPPVVKGNEMAEGVLFIEMERTNLTGRKTKIKVDVFANGEKLETVKTNFFGPM